MVYLIIFQLMINLIGVIIRKNVVTYRTHIIKKPDADLR